MDYLQRLARIAVATGDAFDADQRMTAKFHFYNHSYNYSIKDACEHIIINTQGEIEYD